MGKQEGQLAIDVARQVADDLFEAAADVRFLLLRTCDRAGRR